MKKFIKNYNYLIQKILLKVKNKTKYKPQISNFNKFLIAFISLLFFYLFYLSIPILYEKNFVQTSLDKKLSKEFKINFSTSAEVLYRILPKPHFLIKDAKIYKNNKKKEALAEIKNLKVFIAQKNFFKKDIIIKNIVINDANFSLFKNDFKILKDADNNKFSNKKIKVNNSNIFFKNTSTEVITIVKILKASLFFDHDNLFNLFNLKGEIFNIPFSLNSKRSFDLSSYQELNINLKPLKLNIFNLTNIEKNKSTGGKSIISILNSVISTKYVVEDDMIIFESDTSKLYTSNIKYNGEFSINPSNLDLNITLDNYGVSKILSLDHILASVINTKLLFNDNITTNISLNTNSKLKNEIFNNAIINFNISNGKIDFDETILINKKIGSLELENSDLFLENDRLILNTDVLVDINNTDELFSFLLTNKKYRKSIKKILINLDYDFLTKQFNFNNIKIDNKDIGDRMLPIIDSFNNNNLDNLNQYKRFLNELFRAYEG